MSEISGINSDSLQTGSPDGNVRKRAQAVASALRDFIESGISSGDFKAGQQIPTERELMETFGGGRNIIRKTLIALEAEGKIVRQVGSGTFIAEPTKPKMSASKRVAADMSYLENVAKSAGPFEVMELRRIFEPAAAELAANRASANEAAAIRDAYENSLNAKSIQEFEDMDDLIHRAIADACRNTLFEKVYDIVSVVRNETEWGVMKERSLSDDQRKLHSDEHLEILRAIESRDGVAAREAMKRHLDHVSKMLFSISA
jgi:DNA-binding FadR family transcriptional regulator